jgi:zinc/manganese transport system permease protein
MLADASAHLTWNLVDDVRQLLSYHFMVNAFRAGTIVAVLAGTIGWFMVLRRESFAGHTLALVGFPGAAAAAWLGISVTLGYFVSCAGAALLIAGLAVTGSGGSDESAGIGVVQAGALALGFLFIALYQGSLSTLNAFLFGTFLGITDDQVWALLAIAAAALTALTAVGRPLLFASIDPDVAAGRGVPVRSLTVAFLLILGLTVAEVSQITGALLVFALLVMPAAAAQSVTARPRTSLALTLVLSVSVTWLSLAAAYFSPWPIGFYVTTFAFAAYLTALLGGRALSAHRRVATR